MKLAVCNPSGIYNFEGAHWFLNDLCVPYMCVCARACMRVCVYIYI
jgi:hypothetical protein